MSSKQCVVSSGSCHSNCTVGGKIQSHSNAIGGGMGGVYAAQQRLHAVTRQLNALAVRMSSVLVTNA